MTFARSSLLGGLTLAVALVAMTVLLQPATAVGAVIEVDTTTDQSGNAPGCSLRQAISAAQTDAVVGGCPAGAGADSILLPAGVYRLTIPGMDEGGNLTGDLNVTGPDALTIEPAGDGRVVIDANGIDRALNHFGAGSLAIRDLTIRGGRLNVLADGGGILNGAGSLTLDRVTLVNNSAVMGDGGALANYGNAVLINTTLAGNSARRSGGGIYAPGGSVTTLRSVTITGNVADAGGTNSGDGGGIVTVGLAVMNALNTVIAGNFDKTAAGTTVKDCATGPGFFPRHTLIGERDPAHCVVGLDPGTNLTGDAKLGPLANNGGLTATALPAADSPLIDAGGSAAPDLCPTTDQRGVLRPQGAGCDIGAVERDPEGLDAPGGLKPPAVQGKAKLRIAKPRPRQARVRPGRKVRFRVVVRNRGNASARGMRVCIRLSARSRRAIKVLGRNCTRPRLLRAGKRQAVSFRVRVRSRANASRHRLRFVARARGHKPVRTVARLRIR